jgi:uncharacterized protein YndB with AHSA1/START domain
MNAPLTEQDRVLVIKRTFDAPRDLVWKCWTTPEMAKQWWGPIEYPANYIDIDFRVGGSWRACLHGRDDGRDLWQGGVIREIVPPRRLVYTFKWDADGERGIDTVVTVEFEEEDGKTLMTFHQSQFESLAERDGHNYGWGSTFDRFDLYLSQQQNKSA